MIVEMDIFVNHLFGIIDVTPENCTNFKVSKMIKQLKGVGKNG